MEEHKTTEKEFLNRSLPFYGQSGYIELKEKKIAIAGCGGVGGITAMTLARMGITKFHLADPGVFDEPDLNRQIGSFTSTIDCNKAEVYKKMILDTNPLAKVQIWREGVTENNYIEFLSECDFMVDCLDLEVSLDLREDIFEICRLNNIFISSSPMVGFGGFIMISPPKGEPMSYLINLLKSAQDEFSFPKLFYKRFNVKHLKLVENWINEKKVKVPSIAPSPMILSGLLCTEIINALAGDKILGGRKPISLPETIVIDPFRMNYEVVNIYNN